MTPSPSTFSTRPWQRGDDGDEAFLWDMLYQSIHVRPGVAAPPRAVLDQPEIAHYLVDFGARIGDDAEIACSTVDGVRIGAAFCRRMSVDDPGYGFVAADVPEVGMAVVALWHGIGVGTALLQALLARHPTMSLSVDDDNVGAARLYRRLGFVEHAQVGTATTMVRRPPGSATGGDDERLDGGSLGAE